MGTDSGTSGAVDGESPLIAAVRAGDTDLVKRLLPEGSDPDARDAHGTPAIRPAVRTGSGAIVQLLLDHGADPRQCGPDGQLPLRAALPDP
jgi:ankyrin repeat protein